MMLLQPPKNPRLDVLCDAVEGKYTASRPGPKETAVDYATRVWKLDGQFRLDCARKFYLSCIDQEDDPLGPIFARGLHLARLAFEEVGENKIGIRFVDRWHRFSYLAKEAYHIDVNEYPLAITKGVEL